MSPPDFPAPFEEPWQAQALAIAESLKEAGVITPRQWSEALGAAIERAQTAGDPDLGDTYYLHVLDALEHLLEETNLLTNESLRTRKLEWEAAYRRTPHGQPVELRADTKT